MDLHIVGGMYITIGLLLLSFTGLYYSFPWYRKGLYTLLDSEYSSSKGGNLQPNTKINQGNKQKQTRKKSGQNRISTKITNNITQENYIAWDITLKQLKKKNNNFQNINLQKGKATIKINSFWSNSRANDQYAFNEYSGELTSFLPYKKQSKSSKISG